MTFAVWEKGETMRLIDADALLKNYQDKVCCGISCVGCPFIIDIVYGGCKFENYMKKAPTVVEFEEPITKVYVRGEKYEKVVRCKDCVHGTDRTEEFGEGCVNPIACMMYSSDGEPDFFPKDNYCGFGERKGDD